MFSKIAIFLITIFTTSNLYSQITPNLSWIVSKKLSESSYGYSTSVGSSSVYVSGSFIGPYHQPDSNDMGGFLIKYDLNGGILWEKNYFSKWGAVRVLNTVDKGNVYVSGGFSGNMQYENSMLTNSGMFLFKYDSLGNLLFDIHVPNAQVQNMFVGANSIIYVVGSCFTDSLFLGTVMEKDAFIAMFDENGNLLNVKSFFYSPSVDNAFDMATDQDGNFYSVGTFSNNGNSYITDSLELISAGSLDGFIAKYNSNAELIWVKTISGPHLEECTSVQISKHGDIYVGGNYDASNPQQSSYFDSIQVTHDCAQKQNSFLAKYNNSGNCQWVKCIKGNGSEDLEELYIDVNENVLITGSFGSYGDSASFENQTIYSTHYYNMHLFIAKYDFNGTLTWVIGSQGGGGLGRDLSGDINGDIYLTGQFGGNFSFGNQSLTGDNEIFLAKISSNDLLNVSTKGREENSMSIFPNPTSNSIEMSYSSILPTNSTLTIKNQLGQLFLTKKYPAQNKFSESLDLSMYPKGVYFIELVSGDVREVKKVVVN